MLLLLSFPFHYTDSRICNRISYDSINKWQMDWEPRSISWFRWFNVSSSFFKMRYTQYIKQSWAFYFHAYYITRILASHMYNLTLIQKFKRTWRTIPILGFSTKKKKKVVLVDNDNDDIYLLLFIYVCIYICNTYVYYVYMYIYI